MLNKSIIQGRLTADPELRQTQSGIAVTTFAIACERDIKGSDGERITDFIDVVCWRGTAEFVEKWFRKGSQILAEGRLQTRTWEDKHGQKRKAVEIVADSVHFCGGKGDMKIDKSTGEIMTEVQDNDLPF